MNTLINVTSFNSATMLNVWKWNINKASECARKSDITGFNHYTKNASKIEALFLTEA